MANENLSENLSQYEAQLHQVEAALTNDPENAELLKLKEDLNDVIKLTKDLIELQPQQKRRKQTNTDWKTGDACKAIWSENAKYFNAVIDMISEDGQTCTVTFDGYGTTEIVRVEDLSSRDWEPPSITVDRHKAKSSRQKREELKEIKKKKAQKKVAKLHEIEQHRETEKNRWKSFTTKVANCSQSSVSYSMLSHIVFFFLCVCVHVCVCSLPGQKVHLLVVSKRRVFLLCLIQLMDGLVLARVI